MYDDNNQFLTLFSLESNQGFKIVLLCFSTDPCEMNNPCGVNFQCINTGNNTTTCRCKGGYFLHDDVCVEIQAAYSVCVCLCLCLCVCVGVSVNCVSVLSVCDLR